MFGTIIKVLLIICMLSVGSSDNKSLTLKKLSDTGTGPSGDGNYEDQVFTDNHKFLVYNGQSFIINKFAISRNFSFTCEKYLPIDFVIKTNGQENVLTAYLDDTVSNVLKNEQRRPEVCKKIRRYVYIKIIKHNALYML